MRCAPRPPTISYSLLFVSLLRAAPLAIKGADLGVYARSGADHSIAKTRAGRMEAAALLFSDGGFGREENAPVPRAGLSSWGRVPAGAAHGCAYSHGVQV